MRNSIIITVGPPCSGKTTWAKQFVKEHSWYIRVNRDDFREMMKASPITDTCTEEFITLVSGKISLMSLADGRGVVIDNTHCKLKYLINIFEMFEGNDFFIRIFDAPLWKLRYRGILRFIRTGKWVPMHVQKAMEKNFKKLLGEMEFLKTKYNLTITYV